MDVSIIRFTLNKKEFKYVLSFIIGWNVITKGIRIPNTILPFTLQPCKYKTNIA